MPKIAGDVSTHSRLKAAGEQIGIDALSLIVSTHSRLKAAGITTIILMFHDVSFNTQPPEGGWPPVSSELLLIHVSTHSRLKAAGLCSRLLNS